VGVQLAADEPRKGLSHGFTILGNYTLSKSTDNVPSDDNTSPQLNAVIAQSPYVAISKVSTKGPSDFDYRHVFVASMCGSSRPVPIESVRAGCRWRLAVEWNLERSKRNSGQHLRRSGPFPDRHRIRTRASSWLRTPMAPAPARIGRHASTSWTRQPLGYGARNLWKPLEGSLAGAGLFNTDFGVSKAFTIREGYYGEFPREFFNFFNRSNFNGPVSSVSAGGFGAILSARDPRIGQLALKLNF